jgi:hypothetical protein
MFLVAGLCAVTTAQGVPRPPSETKRVAATPEQAVRLVAEAFKAGDPNRLLDQVGEPNRSLIQRELQMMLAYEAWESAAAKKFGKDPSNRLPVGSIKESMQRTRSLTVVDKIVLGKDRVRMTIWETGSEPRESKERVTEKTWTAIKIGKGWKLLLPVRSSFSSNDVVTRKGPDGKEIEVRIERSVEEVDAKEMEQMQKALPAYMAVLKKQTREIEAGNYSSRKEATDALRKAERALQEQFTARPPKGREKPAADKAEAVKDKSKR